MFGSLKFRCVTTVITVIFSSSRTCSVLFTNTERAGFHAVLPTRADSRTRGSPRLSQPQPHTHGPALPTRPAVKPQKCPPHLRPARRPTWALISVASFCQFSPRGCCPSCRSTPFPGRARTFGVWRNALPCGGRSPWTAFDGDGHLSPPSEDAVTLSATICG